MENICKCLSKYQDLMENNHFQILLEDSKKVNLQ